MLIIRSEQMKVLERYATERFFEALVSAVAAEFPDTGDLRSRVAAAVERATVYGIYEADDLLWFIGLDLERGEAWEMQARFEWAFDLLNDPGSDVNGRRYRLEKRLKPERV